ncbi:MAG: ATP-binding cassette domain-containing protein [Thermodesulfobacteriota bacterium]
MGKSFRRQRALEDISLEVEPGEVYGLLGPDGAGKSSLLFILAGLLLPGAGQARVGDYNVAADPEAVKALIGFMPQGLGANLCDTLTVQENLEFFGELRELPPPVFARHSEELLHITNLDRFRDRLAMQLSGGMRQKLALCCALIHLPNLLLLDEPNTGVDPLSRLELWGIINRLVTDQKATVVLATSYLDEAERCHRVAFLHQGRILFADTPENLLAQVPAELAAGRSPLEEVFIRAVAPAGGYPPPPLPPPLSLDAPLALEVEDMTRVFGTFTAVEGVSFQVHQGEIFAFLGPNGAGKTTLIRMLIGLLAPTRGRARLAGLDLTRDAAKIKPRLGYMSQKFSLYRDLNVEENLRLYGGIYGLSVTELKDRIREVLESIDLAGLEEHKVADLPLGLRQRLALGCALLHRPAILFLDEPTSGVDPLVRRRFWQIIHQLAASGVTVLVTTHYLEEAEHCHRLALMHHGRLVALGSPGELRSQAEAGQGRILEVTTPEFRQAFPLVRQTFPRVSLYGRALHIPSLNFAQDAAQVQKILDQAHLPVAALKESHLSLEETFVYFIRQAAGEDDVYS